MMKKATVTILPNNKTVNVRVGSMFLTAAMLGRVAIQHRCGGKGSCGTCKVKVESGTPLIPPTESEHRLLSEEELSGGYRLSCQCKVSGDAVITIPESPLERVIRQKIESRDSD
ncbi:2Fe-2S iron-sulfur cluster-binding protein [Effusibacillus consociatus]|uniref:2Fe-2S iron-sulfur cluster-binding protein n=1 Tax=Effusibacillus consociatus TaxID=1117041 RepID=A0ABV9Q966_9BACL